jgi:hypothetical protein
MATFRSLKLAEILAQAQAGQLVPGDLVYANDQNPGQLFLVVTGNPSSALYPMSSLILSGNYQLEGAPGPQGIQGEVGPAGPVGPGVSLAQVIATSIALG